MWRGEQVAWTIDMIQGEVGGCILEFLGFAYREIELAHGRRSRHSIVN